MVCQRVTVSTTWRSSPVVTRGLSFSTATATKIRSGGSRTFRKHHSSSRRAVVANTSTTVTQEQKFVIAVDYSGGASTCGPTAESSSPHLRFIRRRGEAYRWDNGFCCQLADVPLFDVHWIVDPGTAGHNCAVSVLPQVTRQSETVWPTFAESKAITGDGGHNATFRAACKLRDSGLTADEAFQALLLWNETNALPPWSAKELAHKVDDAYRNV